MEHVNSIDTHKRKCLRRQSYAGEQRDELAALQRSNCIRSPTKVQFAGEPVALHTRGLLRVDAVEKVSAKELWN